MIKTLKRTNFEIFEEKKKKGSKINFSEQNLEDKKKELLEKFFN